MSICINKVFYDPQNIKIKQKPFLSLFTNDENLNDKTAILQNTNKVASLIIIGR